MKIDFLPIFKDEWVLVLCLLSFVIIFELVKRFARPLFPVTCWFCGGRTKVPVGNRNCWDCPQCEQYNGFTKDGGYNKPIPAQYQEDLNHPTGCKKTEFLTKGELLCAKCMENQSAKVRQLAHFEASDEKNFNVEVGAFQRYLEEVYKLCSTCQNKVDQTIQEQDQTIWSRLNDSLRSKLSFLHAEKHYLSISPFLEMNNNRKMMVSYFLHTVEVFSSLGLLLRQVQLDTEQTSMLQAYFPELSILHPLLLLLDRHVWHLTVVLILSGILAKVIVSTDRILRVDFINSVSLLMVLFTQCDIFAVFGTGSPQEVAVFVMCHVTSIFCLLIGRKTNNPVQFIKPKKLHTPVPRNKLSASESSSNLSTLSTKPSKDSRAGSTACTDPCKDDSISTRTIHHDQFDGQNVNYSFTVFKLESCNLGYDPLISLSGSQFRSRSSSVSSQKSSRSSYAGTLSAQKMSGNRCRDTGSPLISPSRFTPTSNIQRTPQSQVQYGLFPPRPPEKDHNISQASSTSATCPSSQSISNTSMFERYPRSLSTPPVVTRFGASPYSMTFISRDHKTQSDKNTSERHDLQYTSLHRNDSFKHLRDMKEESDDDDDDDANDISDSDSVESDNDSGIDSVSHFTSVSHQATDYSHTTVTDTPVKRKKRLFPWIVTVLSISLLMVMLPGVNIPLLHPGLIFL